MDGYNMNNDNNKEVLEIVNFYRHGKEYYYKYNGETYILSNVSINKLKEQLHVPFKVVFYGMSRAQIGRVVADLKDYEYNIEIHNITGGNRVKKIEVIFTKKKKIVAVYKVPSECNLDGRTNNINPFLYTTLNNKKLLVEINKDDALENINNCYFLESELSERECEFFSDYYTDLECDSVLRIGNEVNTKKTVKKKIRI